jgi:hypothetical protein
MFLLEPCREIVMGSDGGGGGRGYGFGLCKMKSEQSTNFCWVCFAGMMPASYILYNLLWVQEDQRRARIVNSAEKVWMQQRLNLRLQSERPTPPKPINHENSLILGRGIILPFELTELD